MIVTVRLFARAKDIAGADTVKVELPPGATVGKLRRELITNYPTLSGLPAFLTREGGVNSGFMMAQVTAAAVASELKSLAHPAGVDTIPTSANREDHVSMSMTAAIKAATSVSRAREVIATITRRPNWSAERIAAPFWCFSAPFAR